MSQASAPAVLPPGLLVEGGEATIAEVFAALCPLQPLAMTDEGLVCAPRAAPAAARAALAGCPLPVRPLPAVPGWPDPPSAMVAGWYRRSPAHVAAPEGVRELIQAPGEGFGPGDHATTAMCLEELGHLPASDAVDVGCGSGLLAQAWVRLHDRPVVAWDLDPRAIDQARRSLEAAGLAGRVTLRHGPLESIGPSSVVGRTVLANIPAHAHAALAALIADPPHAMVISGIRPGQVEAIVDAYRAAGLFEEHRRERAGFICSLLVSA